MQLKSILDKYDVIEAQVLYNKAVELLQLISDEQLLRDKQSIKDAIDVFIETIESRNLTKDEFDAMTLDDIKDYMNSIITTKLPCLHRIINELEDKVNDSRNQAN
jgi:hypothetical protein